MEAIILVGGFGTRLRPLTLTVPKPLLSLANVPMLERLVRELPAQFDRVLLAVNYRADDIASHFGNIDTGREVIVVPEPEPLGTGGAMRNCRDHVTGTVAVFNGDVVSSLDLTAMLTQHRATGARGTLALWEVADPSRYGVVELRGTEILQFQEKPAPGTELSQLINAGTYLLEPELLDLIPTGRKVSVEREIFPVVAGDGLHGFPFGGYWVDAGTPESYLEANRLLLARQATVSHRGAEIRGRALIADDAALDGCVIGPDAVIGPGVQLTACEVRHSVVLGGVTARDAVIAEAIVGPDITLAGDCRREVIAPSGRSAW